VASVPLDNWRQHSELQLFYRYVIDNQGFIVQVFAFASWRVSHSPRMQYLKKIIMKNEIIWENGNSISQNDIEKVEFELEVQFPYTFRELILENNYSQPSLYLFNTKKSTGNVIGRLLGFKESDKRYILDVINTLSDALQANLIPFALDPGGNYICFDYRESKMPSIIFWNHEQSFKFVENRISIPSDENFELHEIEFISNSFDEFLDILYEDE
jgi:hypothetical protein